MTPVVLAPLFLLQLPTQSTGQLSFGVTQEDLQHIDAAAIRWTTLRTFVGGVEAELLYNAEAVTAVECRAVALLGVLQLRNHYVRQRKAAPVAMRMDFRCGTLYDGRFRYNGVIARLEIRDGSTGDLIYEGRRRGLP